MEVYIINSFMEKSKLAGYRLIDISKFERPADVKAYLQRYKSKLESENKTYKFIMNGKQNAAVLSVGVKHLKEAMRSNSITIMNANYTSDGKIVGSKYPLERNIELKPDKFNIIVLCDDPYLEGNYITVCFADKVVLQSVTLSELSDALEDGRYNILNRDYVDELKVNSMKKLMGVSRDLESEALDENSDWTFDKFDRFMTLKGWRYEANKEYEGLSISYIDARCDILHLPIETLSCPMLYAGKPTTNIKKMIINSNMMKLGSVCTGFAKSINEIIYDRDDYVVIDELCFSHVGFDSELCKDFIKGYNSDSSCGIWNVHVKKLKNMPLEEYSVASLLNYSIIDDIEGGTLGTVNPYKACALWNSFCGTSINGNVRINYRYLNGAFKGVRITGGQISIGEGAVEIRDSFNNITPYVGDGNYKYKTNYKLDLSEAKRLETIANSFNGTVDVGSTLDLSKIRLRRLESSFNYTDNLENVIYGNGSERFSMDTKNFLYTKMKEVRLPDNITKMTFDLMKRNALPIIFPKSITAISHGMLEYYTGEEDVTFEADEITELYQPLSCYRGSTNNCKQFSTIRRFPDRMFLGSSLELFDSGDFPKVQKLSKFMFKHTDKLHTIILRDNIMYTKQTGPDGEETFAECFALCNLVIGKNVGDITTKMIRKAECKVGLKVYVVKDSYAHKTFKRAKNIELIVLNDVEDAVKAVYEGLSMSDKYLSRMKMMALDDATYNNLTDEHNKTDVKLAYETLKVIGNQKLLIDRQRRLKLDTSKFSGIPVSCSNTLQIRHANSKSLVKIPSGYEEIYMNKFVTMCRFITCLSNNDSELNSEEFYTTVDKKIEKVLNICDVGNAQIFYIELESHSWGRPGGGLFSIVMNGNIVYTTSFASEQYNSIVSNEQNFLIRQRRADYFTTYGPMIKKGDFMGTGEMYPTEKYPRLSGVVLKDAKSRQEVGKAFMETTAVIGYKGSMYEKAVGDGFGSIKQHRIRGTVYLLDTVNAYILECKGTFNIPNQDYGKIIDYTNVDVVGITDIMNTGEFAKVLPHIKLISKGFVDKTNRDMVLKVMYSDEVIDKYRKDESRHDLSGNKPLMELGKACYKSSIFDIDSLLRFGGDTLLKATKSILESDILGESKYTSSDIQRLSQAGKITLDREVVSSDSQYTIEQYRAESEIGRSYLINVVTSSNNRRLYGAYRYSYVDLDKVIEMLYYVGKSLMEERREPLLGVSDAWIDRNQFIEVDEWRSQGYKISVVVDKANFDPYIAKDNGNEIQTYLRFKSFRQCIAYFRTYKEDLLIQAHEKYSYSAYADVRKEIMAGFPNGVPYGNVNANYDKAVKLINLLAKQMPAENNQ